MKKTVITALITPFKNNKPDLVALERLIEFQLKSKVDGILILGTTGEASTITPTERRILITRAKEILCARASLLVGCSSNDTRIACRLAYDAEKYGADTILCLTPYYNKCSDQGAYLHFSTIAASTQLPVVLYNVPSRTGYNLKLETVEALSEIKNIVAVKEASGNFPQIIDIITKTSLALYSGDDLLTLPIYALGGAGVISVVSNIMPSLIVSISEAYSRGDLNFCQSSIPLLKQLNELCFSETNPIPVKYMLHLMGFCDCEYRLPLTPPSENTKQALAQAVDFLKLI